MNISKNGVYSSITVLTKNVSCWRVSVQFALCCVHLKVIPLVNKLNPHIGILRTVIATSSTGMLYNFFYTAYCQYLLFL